MLKLTELLKKMHFFM